MRPPGDGLTGAAAAGQLRSNVHGYTDDECANLIGLGGSSISRLPDLYVQNVTATPAWSAQVATGGLARAKDFALTAKDRLRGRAIEMLMCKFHLDLGELRLRFGGLANTLAPVCAALATRFGDLVRHKVTTLEIATGGRRLTRLVAQAFDAHIPQIARFS